MFKRLLLLALLALPLSTAAGQTSARSFSIFLDCQDFYCDTDFYRTDIAFVDHVRERTAADVHVLLTRQGTGGGGASFTMSFYGQNRFAGVSDTVVVNVAQGSTEDEQRRIISRTVKLGLVRYLMRTPDGSRGSFALDSAAKDAPKAGPTKDPWNAWVFRASANLNAQRERDYENSDIFSSLSAARVTELWKTNFRVNGNYSEQSFNIDGEKVSSFRRDYSGALQQVRSFGEHWSGGFKANGGSSTFLNQDFALTVAPAIEYDIFPYKEYTRRALMLQYSVGMKHFRYKDTTVYYKTRETRPFESLNIALAQKQKWGSVRFEVNGYHYLDDLSKSRLTFYSEAEVRLFKGLSLNLYGDYAVLHDQIYLAKGRGSREEVLLRQSQIATTYRAYLYMGLSYTFGSVLNNVVNPRFSNSSSSF